MNKVKISIIIIGGIFFSLGLGLLFTPFPDSDPILDIYGTMQIEGDSYYSSTQIYPMFSTHQTLNIDIYALNGSFSLIIMDWEEIIKWIEEEPYSALYFSSNLTYINEKISVSPLNNWPYLRCSIVIKPEGFLIITGSMSADFFKHYIITAIILLFFACLIFIYFSTKFYKFKKKRSLEKQYKRDI